MTPILHFAGYLSASGCSVVIGIGHDVVVTMKPLDFLVVAKRMECALSAFCGKGKYQV